MKQNLGRTLLICAILSIICSNIPALFGITDTIVCNAIFLIIDLLLLLYLGNALVKAGFFERDRQTPLWRNIVYLLPVLVLIICYALGNYFSYHNIFYYNFGFFTEGEWIIFAIDIVAAIYDELLFRLLMQNNMFSNASRIKRILLSSLVYCAFEFIAFAGIQILFTSIGALIAFFAGTFLFGCIEAFIMEYGHSVYPCIIFHILFTLVFGNMASLYLLDLLFDSLLGFATLDYLFSNKGYIIPIIGEILASLYLAFSYNFYFRKKEY